MMEGEKTSVSEDALYLGLEEGVSIRWTGIWMEWWNGKWYETVNVHSNI